MKKTFLFAICLCFMVACNNGKKTENQSANVKNEQVENTIVIRLSENDFKEKVFDFEKNPNQWAFKGEKPCIVDCYADWCRPCKKIAPFFDTLALEYKGKVDFYKVNVDEARGLSAFFRINSIPTVFFCSKNDVQYSNGAYPIEFYRHMIDSLLLK